MIFHLTAMLWPCRLCRQLNKWCPVKMLIYCPFVKQASASYATMRLLAVTLSSSYSQHCLSVPFVIHYFLQKKAVHLKNTPGWTNHPKPKVAKEVLFSGINFYIKRKDLRQFASSSSLSQSFSPSHSQNSGMHCVERGPQLISVSLQVRRSAEKKK